MDTDYYEKLFLKLDDYKTKILNSSNYKEVYIDLYNYLAKICPNLFSNNYPKRIFFEVLKKIQEYEALIPDGYIIDTVPKIDRKLLPIFPSTDELLDYIIYTTLDFISLNKKDIDIKTFDFTNFCCDAVMQMEELCASLDIDFSSIDLEPGFTNNPELYNGTGFHYFGIATINNEYYLLDPTYRQFFTKRHNFLERIQIPFTSGCLPGLFMLMKEERFSVAKTLIKRGWIKINDEIYKNYMDGFAISYRNGIYYEYTGNFSYTTKYTVDDYQRFINGEDNQVNHEGIESLGYQLRPSIIRKR